jgi:YbgC/YbaW family acyl-CoA thioester hydrolase
MSEKTFCRISYRIPFSETDAMGIVHHSNHARYLERGRVEFLRLTPFDYAAILKRGFHFPLTDLKISFKKPLAFDDIILVETEIASVGRARMSFSYRVFTGGDLSPPSLTTEPIQGTPAVIGETFHCCTNEKGRPVEIAKDIYQEFHRLQGGAP